MSLLKPAENQTAYLKAGLMGFAKSGKTFTASMIAIGLHKMIGSKKPVAFVDTETGSDFMMKRFKDAGIKLMVAKTRSFTDLNAIVDEAEETCETIIVDSISAFWYDFVESYKKKKQRSFIRFDDWGVLKPTWREEFTDRRYLNSRIHFIICGRAGYEYDYTDPDEETGKRELIKTGTKMKAETEFGFEPSLLLEMDRVKVSDPGTAKTQKIIHRCLVLGDRSDVLTGKTFDDPDFDCFRPSIETLNLGGDHVGINLDRDSQGAFDDHGDTDRSRERKMRKIHLDEIREELVRAFPGQSQKDKKSKADLLEKVFGTRSWEKIEIDVDYEYGAEVLGVGLGKLRVEVDNIVSG